MRGQQSVSTRTAWGARSRCQLWTRSNLRRQGRSHRPQRDRHLRPVKAVTVRQPLRPPARDRRQLPHADRCASARRVHPRSVVSFGVSCSRSHDPLRVQTSAPRYAKHGCPGASGRRAASFEKSLTTPRAADSSSGRRNGATTASSRSAGQGAGLGCGRAPRPAPGARQRRRLLAPIGIIAHSRSLG
jgi:hypothetical protein